MARLGRSRSRRHGGQTTVWILIRAGGHRIGSHLHRPSFRWRLRVPGSSVRVQRSRRGCREDFGNSSMRIGLSIRSHTTFILLSLAPVLFTFTFGNLLGSSANIAVAWVALTV